LAEVALSDGIVEVSDTSNTEATGTVGLPLDPQGGPNDEPQSLVSPPQAASARVSSAESHLNLRIIFT
jgi:hypothetical protein